MQIYLDFQEYASIQSKGKKVEGRFNDCKYMSMSKTTQYAKTCAINKSPLSNRCLATSITSIRYSVKWPTIHGTLRTHELSLNDNPIGAFRRVCCEPLRETSLSYH